MQETREVIIEIDKETGEFTVNVKGFEGTSCDAIQDIIAHATGSELEVEHKPAYYEVDVQNVGHVGG